jgi:hypothetical protein
MSAVESRPAPQHCLNGNCNSNDLVSHCPDNPQCSWRVCNACKWISTYVKSKVNPSGWRPAVIVKEAPNAGV